MSFRLVLSACACPFGFFRLLHKAMMSGATMLPDSDAYGPYFRRVSAKIRRFDLGFEAQRDQGQGRLVESLTPGSEADKAGIRVGDRVVVRFNTESAFRDPEILNSRGHARFVKQCLSFLSMLNPIGISVPFRCISINFEIFTCVNCPVRLRSALSTWEPAIELITRSTSCMRAADTR
jgi:hypothetical protein